VAAFIEKRVMHKRFGKATEEALPNLIVNSFLK
jgi:hypothetical protein